MMQRAGRVAAVLAGLSWVTAAGVKCLRPEGVLAYLDGLGVGLASAWAAVAAVIAAEASVGALLLSRQAVRPAALFGAAMLLAFTGLQALAPGHPGAGGCGCFGGGVVDSWWLPRNVALLAIHGLVLRMESTRSAIIADGPAARRRVEVTERPWDR